MKKIYLPALLLTMTMLFACKRTASCDNEGVVHTAKSIVNEQLCQDCVSEFKDIRLTSENKDTGAKTCNATMVVTRGVFTNERNIGYTIEKTEKGEDFVNVFGVPKYFNMSGR